ncbi:MAG TPA: type II toxin-antitoxin system VapC family toxin [Phycisphaerae bacterium]|nr:type II toxin-antitoxin system VapC family toxin [Phycisphaerae bacterium]
MTPEPPSGARCFVDANILVYNFTQNPTFSAPSEAFVRRMENGDVAGFVSPAVLSETLHRVMLSEVHTRYQTMKPLAYVQRRPEIIPTLSGYHAAAKALRRWPLTVLSMDANDLEKTAQVASRHRLLTDDASHVALMQREQIQYLITNDDDFDAVPGIIPCKPR